MTTEEKVSKLLELAPSGYIEIRLDSDKLNEKIVNALYAELIDDTPEPDEAVEPVEETRREGEKVYLTNSQIKNLAEWFEFDFIPYIREDTTIDNINYICDMCDIYKKLKEVSE